VLDVSDAALRVLAAIAADSQLEDSGNLASAIEYGVVARMIGKCPNAVRASVRALVKAGYVSCQLRPGYSNITTIMLEPIRADIRKALDRVPEMRHIRV
jgi:hypothetical protein